MADKDHYRSTNEVSKSSSQVQRKLDPVKKEEQELDPIVNSTKRRKTNTDDVGLWRGNAVGPEAKELLEAIDHHYPNTFQRVQIRSKPIRLTILKELHVAIKRFMETSVNALQKEHTTSLQEDLEEFEKFGFDLSWARRRLDMVKSLKFGNEPLHTELMTLEDSLEPLKERVVGRWKQLMEAHDMWKKAELEYENAKHVRDKKAQEVAHKFGVEFDRVLKGHLGFGMLPGY